MNRLYDELLESLSSMQASNEREHILALLRRATVFRMKDPLTIAIAQTVAWASRTIELNLDHIQLPHSAMWVEYDHQTRAQAVGVQTHVLGNHSIETVGCLLCADPRDNKHIIIFAGWRLKDKSIHHSYALMHWNLDRLYEIARSSIDSKNSGAEERLLEGVEITVPTGLQQEMRIWQLGITEDSDSSQEDTVQKALIQTKRDILGEHLFLLCGLLLIESGTTHSAIDSVVSALSQEAISLDDTSLEKEEISEEDKWEHEEYREDTSSNFTIDLSETKPRRWWNKGGFSRNLSGKLVWHQPKALPDK